MANAPAQENPEEFYNRLDDICERNYAQANQAISLPQGQYITVQGASSVLQFYDSAIQAIAQDRTLYSTFGGYKRRFDGLLKKTIDSLLESAETQSRNPSKMVGLSTILAKADECYSRFKGLSQFGKVRKKEKIDRIRTRCIKYLLDNSYSLIRDPDSDIAQVQSYIGELSNYKATMGRLDPLSLTVSMEIDSLRREVAARQAKAAIEASAKTGQDSVYNAARAALKTQLKDIGFLGRIGLFIDVLNYYGDNGGLRLPGQILIPKSGAAEQPAATVQQSASPITPAATTLGSEQVEQQAANETPAVSPQPTQETPAA
jgi:hypothetical protein